MTVALREPTILLDCRWLPLNGAGRLTELLLRGFQRSQPAGRWLLWGPEEPTRKFAWPGAEVVGSAVDPRRSFGQRSWFDVPPCDLAVFFHQTRPLRPVPSVTIIHDTIPLRYGSGLVVRAARRRFLRRVVAISREVITVSEYSKSCIARDLGADAARVTVVQPPADAEFAARVRRLRAELPAADAAVYVGALLPHKNTDRLVAAFARTDMAAAGGRLWLVGGAPQHREALEARLTPEQRRVVDFVPRCSQAELDRLFATALLLVQPSLEEGFGLPVWEALSCDLPVCVSDGGSLPEITAGLATPFPATSVEAMTASIDHCASEARRRRGGSGAPAAPAWSAPSAEHFARQFDEIVRRNLR